MSTQDLAANADTANAALVSSHHNEVTLNGSMIRSVAYNGTFDITKGQPKRLPPTIGGADGRWIVDLYCGRKKSAPVAQGYVVQCGGAQHAFNSHTFFDEAPKELNFYAGLRVELNIDGQAAIVELYVAQGSNIGSNNWWLGGAGLFKQGSVAVIPTPSGAVLKVSSPEANRFEFSF